MDLTPNIWLNFAFTSIYKLFQFNTLLNIVNSKKQEKEKESKNTDSLRNTTVSETIEFNPLLVSHHASSTVVDFKDWNKSNDLQMIPEDNVFHRNT